MKIFEAFANKLFARLLASMRALLTRLGVDYPQYRALLEASMRVDFRGSAQVVGMKRGTSPLAMGLIIYALYSLMLSFFIFALPAELYARFILVFGMAILGMVMLVDFGVTLVVPSDIGIVGWRPISSRTYFAARLTNALFYIALFSLALHLIPSLFGVLGKDSSPGFPIIFLPCAVMASLFTAGVVAASYATLLRMFRQERFRDVVNYFQIALMILFVLASQLFPRLEGGMLRGRIGRSAVGTAWSWWDIAPPRWFSAPVEMLLHGPNARTLILSAIAVLATVALFVALIRTLSLSYLERVGQAGIAASEPVAPRLRSSRSGVLLRYLLRNHEERAIFDFMRKLLARDRQVRLRLYPMLTYVIIVALPLLFEHRRGGPFAGDSTFSLFLPLFGLGLLSAMLLSMLPFSGESQGEWIFELTGFEKPARVAAAIKRCLVLYFFLPLAFVMAVFFAFFWGLANAAAIVLFALLCALLLFEVLFLFFFRGVPFTRPMTSGRSAAGMGYMLVAFLLIGLFTGIAQFFLKTPQRLLLAALILVPITFLLERLGNARYSPQLGASADTPLKLFS